MSPFSIELMGEQSNMTAEGCVALRHIRLKLGTRAHYRHYPVSYTHKLCVFPVDGFNLILSEKVSKVKTLNWFNRMGFVVMATKVRGRFPNDTWSTF